MTVGTKNLMESTMSRSSKGVRKPNLSRQILLTRGTSTISTESPGDDAVG